ncbi:hypothetical protein [Chengkuizengella sediminis]|uniref:hypothetical protein n=1 Tax=Chengkuizengella sediminis TaxID=1885917 RepID=UPI00138A4D40|nr:hypothetical protein [Chengkuizengella sediminis]NDI37254.1 hypothetical protein [Chengkuizengella sediminis]
MSKWIIKIMISVLVIALLSSCQTSTEEPEIRISSATEELKPIYYGGFYKENQEDIEKRLKDFMVGKRFIDLPSIAYGDKIQIEALNFETDEYEFYDYIMDERGNIISNYDINPLNISSSEDGNTEFSFQENHDLEKYRDFGIEGKLIHGLLIRCKIDNSSFAFATLVLSVNK